MSVATALTIAGSDSGGGAGVQADLKTFSAMGVYGLSVITALTAQNTRTVSGIFPVEPDFVRAQMDAVFEDMRIDAVKIGMLGDAGLIRAVRAGLEAHDMPPLVLDPVMVAKSGDSLLAPEAVASLVGDLMPIADLVTPNLPEAQAILGDANPIDDMEAMDDAASRLLSMGPEAVLLKGGHLGGLESPDLLATRDARRWMFGSRILTRNTHGTGCTLSSAVAAGLAHGRDLVDAVADAKDYITDAIGGADSLEIGKGHGPVHHFHALWPQAIQEAEYE